MKGNFHVQFLGEGVAATSPPYPTLGGQPPRSTRPVREKMNRHRITRTRKDEPTPDYAHRGGEVRSLEALVTERTA